MLQPYYDPNDSALVRYGPYAGAGVIALVETLVNDFRRWVTSLSEVEQFESDLAPYYANLPQHTKKLVSAAIDAAKARFKRNPTTGKWAGTHIILPTATNGWRR